MSDLTLKHLQPMSVLVICIVQFVKTVMISSKRVVLGKTKSSVLTGATMLTILKTYYSEYT